MKIKFNLIIIVILISSFAFAQSSEKMHPFSNSMQISLSAGANYPFTDYETPSVSWQGSGSILYFFPSDGMNLFGLSLNGKVKNYSGEENYLGLPDIFSTQGISGSLNGIYSYTIDESILPYFSLGASYNIFEFDSEEQKSRFYPITNGQTKTSLAIQSEIGTYYNVNEDVALKVGVGVDYFLNDNIDAIEYGDFKDFAVSLNVGVSFTLWNSVDSDGDGIEDNLDECPDQAEDIDGFEDYDGCPDYDNDHDGILDIDDGCQNIKEDLDGYQDEDGCPDPDNDGDGILDIDDGCPDIREDFDGFEDEDGCPDVDNDGDGILDINDTCPNEAEVFNGFEDGDGCPDKEPEPKYIPEPTPPPVRDTKPKETKKEDQPSKSSANAPSEFLIHGETTFDEGSTQIKSSAYSQLGRIVSEMKKYPRTVWRIEGHIDRMESKAEALRLSKGQAEAILNYMVSKGLSRSNFQVLGFGDSAPIANNSSVYGRMKNRRIVIKKVN